MNILYLLCIFIYYYVLLLMMGKQLLLNNSSSSSLVHISSVRSSVADVGGRAWMSIIGNLILLRLVALDEANLVSCDPAIFEEFVGCTLFGFDGK